MILTLVGNREISIYYLLHLLYSSESSFWYIMYERLSFHIVMFCKKYDPMLFSDFVNYCDIIIKLSNMTLVPCIHCSVF